MIKGDKLYLLLNAVLNWLIWGILGILFLLHGLKFRGGFSTYMAAFFMGIFVYEIIINKLCFFLTNKWFHEYIFQNTVVPPYFSLTLLLVVLMIIYIVRGNVEL